jgi:lipopolysaccharide biosynthesis regulator YciM
MTVLPPGPPTPDPAPEPWPPEGRRRRLIAVRTSATEIRRRLMRPCLNCGDTHPAWWLVCPACKEWERR